MRIFKTKWFVRFARQHGIKDRELHEVITKADSGLIDANLGGGVLKVRIARPHGGKSGGIRSIILFRSGEKAFFVYGFAKSARANIRKDELEAFRKLADEMLNYTEAALSKALEDGVITEVKCNE